MSPIGDTTRLDIPYSLGYIYYIAKGISLMQITIGYILGIIVGFGIGYIRGRRKVLVFVTGAMVKLMDKLLDLPTGDYTTGAGVYISKLQVLIHDEFPTPVDISYSRKIANDNP